MTSIGERPVALAVLSDLPSPPRSGNHWRYRQNVNLMAALGYEVHVVAGQFRSDVPSPGVEHARLARAVRVEPPSVSPAARLRRMIELTSALGAPSARNPWASAYTRAGLDEAVLDVTRELEPDTILLRSTFAHLVPALRPLTRRLIIDAHDSDVIFAKTLETTAAPWQIPALKLRRAVARRSERWFARADEIWVPADRELAYFKTTRPETPVVLVPNGVPVSPDAPDRTPDGRTLLLFGAFGLPMNLAAADALVDEILPRLLDFLPDCRVDLIGRGLPASRRARWIERPVRLLGHVEDLSSHLGSAVAMVFAPPLAFATGTPLKVSEALAAGVPVATNSAIAAQLGLVNDVHAVLADDPGEMAWALSQLVAHPQRATAIGRAGHGRAYELFSFERILARLQHESVVAPA
jgi:glycosyltransferase involved in cell wall biosynthesis